MDEVREYSTAIHESGGNLLALINDILDLANARSSGDAVHLEPVPLATAVAGVLDILRPQALARGVALSSAVDGEVGTVIADRARLKQILYNLLSNAVKFSPPEGSVTVGARRADDRLWIHVDDEGPGIPPELHEKVFEPFFQADGGITRSHDGAGLGLSLARRWVRLLGGELRLESAAGRGSRFEFSIPQ
jgi:signal transduction histidine kinase